MSSPPASRLIDVQQAFDDPCWEGAPYDAETIHRIARASLHGELASVKRTLAVLST